MADLKLLVGYKFVLDDADGRLSSDRAFSHVRSGLSHVVNPVSGAKESVDHAALSNAVERSCIAAEEQRKRAGISKI